MSYKIGSFNVFKMNYRSDKEIKKDFELIAEIIKEEKYDIIALQEVLNENVMGLLMRYLPGWDYRWATPKKSVGNAAEGYAFIWNSRRITLAKSITTTGEKVFEPRILDQYKIDRKNGQLPLVRNPYYGRFTPAGCLGGCFFEFRLINVHVRYNGSDENSHSAIIMRKNEFDVLAKAIYPKIADKVYGNNMPSYTIMLGDYNLNLKRPTNQSPYLNEMVIINDNGNIKKIVTVQDELTTLKKTTDEDPQSTGYANNYDHFSYDSLRFETISTEVERVDAVSKYCDDDFNRYHKTVSDHVPVTMDVDLL